MNQTTDQAFTLDYYYWSITTMKPSKLQVVCLTSSYYIKHKFNDAWETYTNTLFLSAKNKLRKEIGSRKLGNQLTNFDLDYTDASDFTLVKDIKIPHLTGKELENLGN